MSRMTTLHIIPLQISLSPDQTLSLGCDDPRASYDPFTGLLTINLEVPRHPYPSRQSVRFVVQDPSLTNISAYATMLSGRNARELVQWRKDGNTSLSSYIPNETTVEVWTTVLTIPGDPKNGKIYHGQSKLKIATKGAADDIAIEA